MSKMREQYAAKRAAISPGSLWLPSQKPGDLVFFAGRCLVSHGIALRTCSLRQLFRGEWLSHVGIVAGNDAEHVGGDLKIYESTSLCELDCEEQGHRVCGVQVHSLQRRIESYDGGVWILPIRDPLLFKERERLLDFLKGQLGKAYDWKQAGAAGTTWFKKSDLNPQDDSLLFCSEYCILALKDLGMLQWVNASEWSPAFLARELVRIGLYGNLYRVK